MRHDHPRIEKSWRWFRAINLIFTKNCDIIYIESVEGELYGRLD